MLPMKIQTMAELETLKHDIRKILLFSNVVNEENCGSCFFANAYNKFLRILKKKLVFTIQMNKPLY